MQKGDYLSTILKIPKTTFTLKDVTLLWKDLDTNTAKTRLNYYVRKGDIYRIRRGLYTKNKQYNALELATRIFIPSYVSFETVLAKEGLIFQYQKPITVASYLSRTITINEQQYVYRKMKDIVLTNGTGIELTNETSVATKERAFLDTVYTNTQYHFDNLRSLDWEKVFALLPIYKNKRMEKFVQQLFKQSQKDTV